MKKKKTFFLCVRPSAEEDEEEVKPVVPLSACLAKLAAEETLPDYRSPATGKPGPATKRALMSNFPRYLFVQLRRYVRHANGNALFDYDAWHPVVVVGA